MEQSLNQYLIATTAILHSLLSEGVSSYEWSRSPIIALMFLRF